MTAELSLLRSWLICSLLSLFTCLSADVRADSLANFGKTTGTNSAVAASTYLLGSGDVLMILVHGEEDLSMEVMLDDAEEFTYPFIGRISVDGMTATDLQQRITNGLEGRYLKNPRVSVSMRRYRNFFVNGEVNQPGGYEFQPGLTVRKAVSLAGGFSERASQKNVFLISEKDEKQKAKRVSLNATVKPGDIITVEESFF